MSRLSWCPVCGAKQLHRVTGADGICYVQCPNCGERGDDRPTMEEAEVDWNAGATVRSKAILGRFKIAPRRVKPCPKCKGREHTTELLFDSNGAPMFAIYCKCAGFGVTGDTYKDAVDSWNRGLRLNG